IWDMNNLIYFDNHSRLDYVKGLLKKFTDDKFSEVTYTINEIMLNSMNVGSIENILFHNIG
ncbi:MAG: hypothetical protein KAS39_01855, partial [Actinomycetia bacterium]|nr:hypothetical protein [Actinomycetes bacterium]